MLFSYRSLLKLSNKPIFGEEKLKSRSDVSKKSYSSKCHIWSANPWHACQATQSDLRKRRTTQYRLRQPSSSVLPPSRHHFSSPPFPPHIFFRFLFLFLFIGPMLPYVRWGAPSVKILTGGASLALSAVCSSNKGPSAVHSTTKTRRVTLLLILRPLPSILCNPPKEHKDRTMEELWVLLWVPLHHTLKYYARM